MTDDRYGRVPQEHPAERQKVTGSSRSINERLLEGAMDGEGVVIATSAGIAAGTHLAIEQLPRAVRSKVRMLISDGQPVQQHVPLARASGTAFDLSIVEDHLLGVLGLASGIATRSRDLLATAPAGLTVVCGAWKKLPSCIKPVLRAGLDAAGVGHRLLPGEFVYVDKNSVVSLGGFEQAIRAAAAVDNGPVAVQIKDPNVVTGAVLAGADIVMVDTGQLDDLRAARAALHRLGRDDIPLAFGGGATAADLTAIRHAGADIVDIGRAIVDAPLLDLRFDVVAPGMGSTWPS